MTGIMLAVMGSYGVALAGAAATFQGLFGFGFYGLGADPLISTKVTSTGVVGVTTTFVSANITGRDTLAAATYGGDKAIFGFGTNDASTVVYSMTNLVSNTGVIAADVTSANAGVGYIAAAGFSLS